MVCLDRFDPTIYIFLKNTFWSCYSRLFTYLILLKYIFKTIFQNILISNLNLMLIFSYSYLITDFFSTSFDILDYFSYYNIIFVTNIFWKMIHLMHLEILEFFLKGKIFFLQVILKKCMFSYSLFYTLNIKKKSKQSSKWSSH